MYMIWRERKNRTFEGVEGIIIDTKSAVIGRASFPSFVDFVDYLNIRL